MTLNRNIWTAQDYGEYRKLLLENAEEDYKSFHEKLCKTSRAQILGVRLPKIKKFAAEILKGNAVSFLNAVKNDYYEEVMTEGLVTAGLKMPFPEKIEYTERFLPKIDNWAVCDSVCSAYKFGKNENDRVFRFCESCALSDKEYSIRFGTVLLMDKFITEDYIDKLFPLFDKTDCSYYYTSMAVAWSISFCYIKFREKTEKYLKTTEIDTVTYNRAIQKIADSNRISKEEKDKVKLLRRK